MEICSTPPLSIKPLQSIITIKNTICVRYNYIALREYKKRKSTLNHYKVAPLVFSQCDMYIKLGHDDLCNCCCCCSNLQSNYFKYIQPEIPKSFKPINSLYQNREMPMERNTIYKLSYWSGPIPNASILKPVLPQDSLTVGDGSMTDETIQKLSYLGNWYFERDGNYTKKSSWKTAKQWFARGPMQNDTTHKNDFTWKYIPTLKPCKISNNLKCSSASLSDETTYKLSYYESTCRIPLKSYKPKVTKHVYAKSEVPIEESTTYKLSYWPNMIPPKEKYPWKPKNDHYHSPMLLDDHTTYKLSYWPCNDFKPRKPFEANKTTENILNADNCFDDNTTYNLSYYNCSDGSSKRKPIKPVVRPTEFSTCPLSHDTIHRMSYLGNWRISRASTNVNVPETTTQQWLGRGPIQDVTTHKHDFTWKCSTPDGIHTRPEDNLGFSSSPLECCTTHKLSYWPNDIKNLVRDKSYKPTIGQIDYSLDIPMEKETTMKLSYQPVKIAMSQSKPWAKDLEYHPSFTPFHDDTTYNLSYIPPGTLEPINGDESCPPMSDDVYRGSCNNPLSQLPSSIYTPCCAPCGAM